MPGYPLTVELEKSKTWPQFHSIHPEITNTPQNRTSGARLGCRKISDQSNILIRRSCNNGKSIYNNYILQRRKLIFLP